MDKEHVLGKEEKRFILKLRNVNMWVDTEKFTLLSLVRLIPYLMKGQ